MKTTTISLLRKDIKSYFDGVISNNDTVLVNKGADGAVIISLSEYNRLMALQTNRREEDRSARLLSSAVASRTGYVDVDIDEL